MFRRANPPLLPGLLLCLAVTAASFGLNRLQRHALGHVWLEPLVLAILLGVCVRTMVPLGPRWQRGIAFSARTLLELAVVLLGFSLSARTIVAAGPALPAGIAAIVGAAVLSGYGIGRALGLKHRMEATEGSDAGDQAVGGPQLCREAGECSHGELFSGRGDSDVAIRTICAVMYSSSGPFGPCAPAARRTLYPTGRALKP